MSNPVLPTVVSKHDVDAQNPAKLRRLAHWYRELAERAENPTIWEARLQMAGDLDAEADRMEARR
jgi:hypothetical protein